MSEKLKSTMIRYLIYNKKGEYASSWPIKRTSARTPNFFGTHYSFKHWLNSRYLQYFHIFLTVSASLDVWTLLEKIDYKVQVWSFYALRNRFHYSVCFNIAFESNPQPEKLKKYVPHEPLFTFCPSIMLLTLLCLNGVPDQFLYTSFGGLLSA